jgi:HEAT repeat protein
LRYDGKGFAAWQTQARTELKPQRLVEALEALTAFGRNGYGPEAAEAVVGVARRFLAPATTYEEAQVVKKVEEVLPRIGKAALPVLVKALDDRNREIRAFAVQRLAGGLGCPFDSSAVPGLVRAVLRGEDRRSDAAVVALENVQGVGPALEKELKGERRTNRFVVNVAACAKEPPGDAFEIHRSAALAILARMGPRAAAAVPTLVAMLAGRSDAREKVSERGAAAGVLGEIRGDPRRVISALVGALEDDDAEVRRKAARSLGRYGPRARVAVPALRKLAEARTNPAPGPGEPLSPLGANEAPQAPRDGKREEPAAVKLAAAWAIDRILGDNRAGRVLLGAFEDLKEADARRKLVEAVGEEGGRTAAAALLQAYRRHERDRAVIAAALGRLGPSAREALPILLRARREGDADLRRAAAKAVEAITGAR